MKSLEDYLIEALNRERDARGFYLEASKKAQTRMGKKFFKRLVDFETGHYEQIKKLLDAQSLEKQLEIKPLEPETGFLEADSEVHFEPGKEEILNILLKGIEAEKKAGKRYFEIAGQVSGKRGQEIFSHLAREERYHQRILEDQFYQFSASGKISWNPNIT